MKRYPIQISWLRFSDKILKKTKREGNVLSQRKNSCETGRCPFLRGIRDGDTADAGFEAPLVAS